MNTGYGSLGVCDVDAAPAESGEGEDATAAAAAEDDAAAAAAAEEEEEDDDGDDDDDDDNDDDDEGDALDCASLPLVEAAAANENAGSSNIASA